MHHDAHARGHPGRFIKALDATPQLLGLARRAAAHDGRVRRLVAKQPRLARHHEMLGRGVVLAIDLEARLEPLAHAGLADGAIGRRLVAPEWQEARGETLGHGVLEVLQGGDVVCGGHTEFSGAQFFLSSRT